MSLPTGDSVSRYSTITRESNTASPPSITRQGTLPSGLEARMIVEYLDTLSPVGKLIPPSGRERAEVRTWEALADGILDASILARLEATWAGRQAGQRSQAWIDRQMSRVDAALAAMSKGLGDKAWCAGSHFSLADIATGCALGYLDFRFAHLDWRTRHDNLARLAEKLFARPSFADTLPA